MVTGRLPFTAENQLVLVAMHMNKRPPSPRSIDPHVPPQVERVILKALEKKPEQRFASATGLAEAFCRAVAASKHNGLLERTDGLELEQPGVVASTAEAEQTLPSPLSPAPAVNPTVRPSPPGNAPESQRLIVPQHVLDAKIAGVETPRPRSPSPVPKGLRSPSRRLWFAILLAFLALILLGFSITSLVLPPTNSETRPDFSDTTQTARTAHALPQSPTSHPTPTPTLTPTPQ